MPAAISVRKSGLPSARSTRAAIRCAGTWRSPMASASRSSASSGASGRSSSEVVWAAAPAANRRWEPSGDDQPGPRRVVRRQPVEQVGGRLVHELHVVEHQQRRVGEERAQHLTGRRLQSLFAHLRLHRLDLGGGRHVDAGDDAHQGQEGLQVRSQLGDDGPYPPLGATRVTGPQAEALGEELVERLVRRAGRIDVAVHPQDRRIRLGHELVEQS